MAEWIATPMPGYGQFAAYVSSDANRDVFVSNILSR